MKTAFLFMSYEIKGTKHKGNWRGVVEGFNRDEIGHLINNWIDDRINVTSKEQGMPIEGIFITDIKFYH